MPHSGKVRSRVFSKRFRPEAAKLDIAQPLEHGIPVTHEVKPTAFRRSGRLG